MENPKIKKIFVCMCDGMPDALYVDGVLKLTLDNVFPCDIEVAAEACPITIETKMAEMPRYVEKWPESMAKLLPFITG